MHAQAVIRVEQFELAPQVGQADIFFYPSFLRKGFDGIFNGKRQLFPPGRQTDIDKRLFPRFGNAVLECVLHQGNEQQGGQGLFQVLHVIVKTDPQGIVVPQFFKRDVVADDFQFLVQGDIGSAGFVQHKAQNLGEPQDGFGREIGFIPGQGINIIERIE